MDSTTFHVTRSHTEAWSMFHLTTKTSRIVVCAENACNVVTVVMMPSQTINDAHTPPLPAQAYRCCPTSQTAWQTCTAGATFTATSSLATSCGCPTPTAARSSTLDELRALVATLAPDSVSTMPHPNSFKRTVQSSLECWRQKRLMRGLWVYWPWSC